MKELTFSEFRHYLIKKERKFIKNNRGTKNSQEKHWTKKQIQLLDCII
jgi:hypothetical protein